MSLRVRVFVAVIASICYASYLWYCIRRRRRPGSSVPPNHYEQILAQMQAHQAGLKHGPLDALQVLADVQEWLNSKGSPNDND